MARPKKVQIPPPSDTVTEIKIVDGKAVFQQVPVKDKKVQKTLYLSESVIAKIEELAKSTDTTISDIVETAIKLLESNMVIK